MHFSQIDTPDPLTDGGGASGAETLTPAIAMPGWLKTVETENVGAAMPAPEEKLRFVIELACRNVRHRTGGPFAAAIFNIKDDKLIAVGVNSVVPSNQSWAHAEMTAFSHAQQRLNTFLSTGCMLVTSCEPCAMCYGATPWSGVGAMLYGATREDAEAIGFDEGDKLPAWRDALEKRGVMVYGPALPEESKRPFLLYQSLGGKIY